MHIHNNAIKLDFIFSEQKIQRTTFLIFMFLVLLAHHSALSLGIPTTCEITTKVVNSNPAHGEVYSIQLYVIECVRDLR
jgi:hypothetical protein